MSRHSGWVVRRAEHGASCTLEDFDDDFLDEFDVAVDVSHSAINYKDALALHARPGVVRRFPLVAGIDMVGQVVASEHSRWKPGDRVGLFGGGLGEELHGGLATRAHLSGDSLVPIHDRFTTSQAAAVGTAGLTAALSVVALEAHGLDISGGPVLVTGASGGVGSMAIHLLSRRGYHVVAATGRPEEQEGALRAAGASEIIHRDEVVSERPLASQRWAGVVDCVGGPILAGALAAVKEGGAVAASGLAASPELPTTVLPFILRGVQLLGINSVQIRPELRETVSDLIVQDTDPDYLDSITRTVGLTEAQDAARQLLDGRGTGRTVVDVRA